MDYKKAINTTKKTLFETLIGVGDGISHLYITPTYFKKLKKGRRKSPWEKFDNDNNYFKDESYFKGKENIFSIASVLGNLGMNAIMVNGLIDKVSKEDIGIAAGTIFTVYIATNTASLIYEASKGAIKASTKFIEKTRETHRTSIEDKF